MTTTDRTTYGFARTSCACGPCSVFCRFIPGFLIPGDLRRMAARLNYPDLDTFARDNLLASPGVVAMREGQRIEIPTLVLRPAEGSTACRFLDTQRGGCRIHSDSPYGCSHFDEHMSHEEALERKTAAFLELEREWETGGAYARLWRMLHAEGKVAPRGDQLRHAMAEQLYREATRAA